DLHPAGFCLRVLVNETLRTLALRAHSKGIELICNVHPEVPDALVGDPGRLRQVLLNLVSNAIKFTEIGEVVVRVSVANNMVARWPGDKVTEKSDASSVTLSFEVKDTGIGIPRDKQQSIFQAFEQGDNSTTRRFGGTGLGLSIASRLVDMMGGAIG